MKRISIVVFSIILTSFLFISSCTKEDKATTGSMTILVMDSTGVVVPNAEIHLANNNTDLKNHVYLKSAWTAADGTVTFHELLPQFYWFSATGWDDYGSVRVFSGIDHYVILWLNNREGKK